MKNIIKIDSNLPEDLLRIELILSDVCNYECWYCFPGSNDASVRWPKLKDIVDNLTYILKTHFTNAIHVIRESKSEKFFKNVAPRVSRVMVLFVTKQPESVADPVKETPKQEFISITDVLKGLK